MFGGTVLTRSLAATHVLGFRPARVLSVHSRAKTTGHQSGYNRKDHEEAGHRFAFAKATGIVFAGALGAVAIGLGPSVFAKEDQASRAEICEAGERKKGLKGTVVPLFDELTPKKVSLPTTQLMPNLKEYTREEVSKHDSVEKRIWVTYKNGVYDITDFVPNHPGSTQILMAAGGSMEPFWKLYAFHVNNPEVTMLLEKYRIGNLPEMDVNENELTHSDTHDPWAQEPQRHPVLRVMNKTPFNAEPPLSILAENFITPTEFFYVRNHLPVPQIDEGNFALEVEGIGAEGINFTVDDIKKKFPKVSITATVQCGGNRRKEMNIVRPVLGLAWEGGSIGNAVWSGARLVDVLSAAGVDMNDQSIKHVQFEGADFGSDGDPYGSSVPASIALDPRRDVIIAYEMNGEALPRDHGYPLRVIVPGIVGARSVKWLQRIVLSDTESNSHWQRKDYKVISPTVLENPDFSKYPSIQNMPVTSAICVPEKGSKVKVSNEGKIQVKGYAFSGAGAKIYRVDVSVDGGKSWLEAEIDQHQTDQESRNWAWTLWKVNIPVDKKEKNIEIMAKAVDSNNNVQPEKFDSTWNIRGLLANAYPRVQVTLE